MNSSIQSASVDSQTTLVGKDWDKVYYGYFENPKILQWFEHILQSELVADWRNCISSRWYCEQLWIWDGNGNLTNFLAASLQKAWVITHTTSTDISSKQLEGNENAAADKQVLDISVQNPSEVYNKQFDLISTRSTFHYMWDINSIEASLTHISHSLSEDGIYILQEITYDNNTEIKLVQDIFELFGKPVHFLTHSSFNQLISHHFIAQQPKPSRYYQLSLKNNSLYRKIDINFSKNELFNVFKHWSSSLTDSWPWLFVEQEEFLKRYAALYEPRIWVEKLEDAIIQLIQKVPEYLRPNVLLRNGTFGIHFHYTTLVCSKK